MSLAGKVALITGGSRGIGRATVRLFCQAGARVVFSYRSATPQAESLVAECGGPDYCRTIQQPLSTPEDGGALVTAAIANAFVRVFPTSSLRANLLKQIALLCGAVLFLGLLSLTYGLDLSAGFF